MFKNNKTKRRIGFNVEDENEMKKGSARTFLKNYFDSKTYFHSKSITTQRMLQLLAIWSVLVGFAEKKTGQDGKSVLTVGMFHFPIVKLEMNKGNENTDFKLKTIFSERFQQIAKDRQERDVQRTLLLQKQLEDKQPN